MQGRKTFFFEKRTKKLLVLRVVAPALPMPPVSRRFLLLFFKKEGLYFV
jgi:hypothetical protein